MSGRAGHADSRGGWGDRLLARFALELSRVEARICGLQLCFAPARHSRQQLLVR